MEIRKQVYHLECADLIRCAVWEFVLDEETEAGQDEATVRPWEGIGALDPAEGMFVVRARFVFADSTEHIGYLTPPTRGDASIGTIQPIIVTDKGQVAFWHGVMAPAPDAIRAAYGQLGRTAKEVFLVATSRRSHSRAVR